MALAASHTPLDSGSALPDSSQTASPYEHPHFEACRIFEAAGTKFCIWAEDALSAYGVPTLIFDLHLVTNNVAAAAQLLIEKGFIIKPLEDDIMPIPEFRERYGPPGPEDERDVVLLDASDWNYNLGDTTTTRLPPFDKLLDSLLGMWTDQSSDFLRMRLAIYIGYCFTYVDGVKTLGFARSYSRRTDNSTLIWSMGQLMET